MRPSPGEIVSLKSKYQDKRKQQSDYSNRLKKGYVFFLKPFLTA
jgi:hypothetical protein